MHKIKEKLKHKPSADDQGSFSVVEKNILAIVYIETKCNLEKRVS